MKTFQEYEAAAMSTRLGSADAVYALLGLPGEVGELCSMAAKARRDGVADNDAFVAGLKKEAGDCLWMLVAICHDFGFSLADAAQANVDKLASRKERGTLQGSGDNR
jgi:NTP pyrophosphatase (non-canonical NTP hydrolase)